LSGHIFATLRVLQRFFRFARIIKGFSGAKIVEESLYIRVANICRLNNLEEFLKSWRTLFF
jgi:hypothetical protein